MKKERESNIELLRIVAMLGVIFLHYNNPVMGGGSFILLARINMFYTTWSQYLHV